MDIMEVLKIQHTTGCNVISPALDYDSEAPDKTLDKLSGIIQKNELDAIIGTSYGGFFAVLLSINSKLPVILVNPCLMPFIYLPRLGYKQDIKDFLPMFSMISELDINKVSVIIGGYLIGKNKNKECRYVIISRDNDYDNVIKFRKNNKIKITRKIYII